MTADTVTEQPTPDAASVDVGVTLGELAGNVVVVAAFTTAGITAQLQLPPASAAQAAIAILAAAEAAGLNVANLLASMLSGGSKLEVPNSAQVAHIIREGSGRG